MALPGTTSTVPEGTTDGWTDKKRYLWLFGLNVKLPFESHWPLC